MDLSSFVDSVQKSLERAGVESARVDAEILISHVLKVPRRHIYLEPGRQLTQSEESLVLELVRERQERVPLQYIIGECEFMSLDFKISKGVFIPRPETEILVEALVNRLEPGPHRGATILDLGTGCGVIAVSLADRLAPGLVVASDISLLAVEIAKGNAILNHMDHLVRFVVGDRLSPFESAANGDRQGGFDVVACNPPYVGSAEIGGLEPEVRDYEPRSALDGGEDGLEFIAGILPGIPSILRDGGIVGIEIGETQTGSVKALFENVGLRDVEVVRDLNGRDRAIIARRA